MSSQLEFEDKIQKLIQYAKELGLGNVERRVRYCYLNHIRDKKTFLYVEIKIETEWKLGQ